MSELTVILGIFAAGPVVAATFLSWDEWRQWRIRQTALRSTSQDARG